MGRRRWECWALLASASWACGRVAPSVAPATDAATAIDTGSPARDAQTADRSLDVGSTDGGPLDARAADSGVADVGRADAQRPTDSGTVAPDGETAPACEAGTTCEAPDACTAFPCNACIAWTCGGGGEPGQCGCAPASCAAARVSCGTVFGSCGDSIDCGTCTAPASCGGGGIAGECGCTPLACGGAVQCGTAGDGCGGTLDCGNPCAPGATCVNNQCVDAGCAPQNCAEQGIACGTASDQCGNLIECGLASPLFRVAARDTSCSDGVHTKAYAVCWPDPTACLGGPFAPAGWSCVLAGPTSSTLCCK